MGERADNVYRVLVADAASETLATFERALLCCPRFELQHTVGSISELVSYLAAAGNFIDNPYYSEPHLVLLDLHLSGRDSGLEVLKWVQAQPSRQYRVVVLSRTVCEAECERVYALGADGFMSKPTSVDDTIIALTRIKHWLNSSLDVEPFEFSAA